MLEENQSSSQTNRRGGKQAQNGSDESWNATKESKLPLDEREEEKDSIENESVFYDITFIIESLLFLVNTISKLNLNSVYYVMSKLNILLYVDKIQFHK